MQQMMIERGQLFVDLTQGISACHVCIDASKAKLLMNFTHSLPGAHILHIVTKK